MALRLRKDVQKASYYVWFLGAEEARGLRGPRVLLPAIAHLLDRAREHEPLKVTLQVSHKGMKIVQGSSKHFITHSAITCSVQTDDIVACVLLLYNPATKCPLHVHAYRCDSETTAQALNQLLQVLINRPENQKRFAELEAKLGLQHAMQAKQMPPTKNPPKRIVESSPPKRFDSTLGSSDTGTSTRESECSEEHLPIAPIIPATTPIKTSIFDSLAAELRAKLNGHGPPLLLPPRDYDTVHRSKGNLAAMELRRCRNSQIVGGPGSTKKVVSSKGSSGIGSDLAPSPERHDVPSSSDDEWVQNKSASPQSPIPTPVARSSVLQRQYPVEQPSSDERYMDDGPPSYLYPKDQPIQQKYHHHSNTQSNVNNNNSNSNNGNMVKRSQRSLSREEDDRFDKYVSGREEEDIKPIIIRPRNFDARFKDVLQDTRKYNIDDVGDDEDERLLIKNMPEKLRSYNREHEMIHQTRYIEDGRRSNDDGSYHNSPPATNYRYSENNNHGGYRENLTDKQKYRESLMEKEKQQFHQNRQHVRQSIDSVDFYRNEQQFKEHSRNFMESPENMPSRIQRQRYEKSPEHVYKEDPASQIDKRIYQQQHQHQQQRYVDDRHQPHKFNNRGSYQEPYIDGIDKVTKLPIMRYKSYDDEKYYGPESEASHMEQNFNKFKQYPMSQDQQNRQFVDRNPVREKYVMGNNNSKLISRRDTDDDIIRQQQQHFNVTDRRHNIRNRSPPDTISKVSPKHRFANAKEKFQQMERERQLQEKNRPIRNFANDQMRTNSSIEQYSNSNNEFYSSDDESASFNRLRIQPNNPRDIEIHNNINNNRYSHMEKAPLSRMSPAKSLGNLVKGYRHSYAEPQRHPLPRNNNGGGRMGVTSVNQF